MSYSNYDKYGYDNNPYGQQNYYIKSDSYAQQSDWVSDPPEPVKPKEVFVNGVCGSVIANKVQAVHNCLADRLKLNGDPPWCTSNDFTRFFDIITRDQTKLTKQEIEFLLKYERKVIDYGDARYVRDYKNPFSEHLSFRWGAPRDAAETQEILGVTTDGTTNHSSTTATNTKKEDQNMAANTKIVALPTTTQLTTAFKANLEDAAWQSCGEQAVELGKSVIKATLSRSADPRMELASAFLDTPEGTAFVGMLLGSLPLFSPALAADPRAARLTNEMRTKSVKFVTDLIAKHLAGPLTAAFSQALAAAPQIEAK